MLELDGYSTHILTSRHIAEDTVAFNLNRPKDFTFKAGQYISVRIEGFEANEEDDGERMLSIASAPDETSLTIAMRMRQSRFKQYLSDSKQDVRLVISPAMGDFILPDSIDAPLVMVAGGIGITPFYSMLQALRDRAAASPLPDIHLLYGNRHPGSIAWRPELQAMASELPWLTVTHVLESGANEIPGAYAGRIDEAILKQAIPDWAQRQFYIVGPTLMVATLQDTFDAMGLPPENAIVEFFAGY